MSCQRNSNEWRCSFTTVLLGIIALTALLVESHGDNINPVVSVGLLFIILTSLLLMVFLLVKDLKALAFKNVNKLTGSTDINLSTFKVEHQTIETVIGLVPERNRIEKRSAEEEILSLELKQILDFEKGLSLSNCHKGLGLLAEHESIVKTSWTHTLNKARLLGITRQFEEAEELASDVITKFSNSVEAVGIAYEVLSFIEEFRRPKGTGRLYLQWLSRRREFVMEGLKFFPTGHDLLMNAFEIATLQGNATEALNYLNKAALVDRDRTQRNLVVNPLTPTATELSLELKSAIKELMKGDSKMRLFEMIRVRALILVLVIAFTFSSIHQTKEIINRPVSARTLITMLFGHATSICKFSRSDGTGFGYVFISFKSIGTGFGDK